MHSSRASHEGTKRRSLRWWRVSSFPPACTSYAFEEFIDATAGSYWRSAPIAGRLRHQRIEVEELTSGDLITSPTTSKICNEEVINMSVGSRDGTAPSRQLGFPKTSIPIRLIARLNRSKRQRQILISELRKILSSSTQVRRGPLRQGGFHENPQNTLQQER
ncbi:hypothetical protein SCHPADRAFT_279505 [Schizopora paradoxa]|uniref:Uncharacterized protein n=1 Tax=Schizopora paradoxa TaxID=27342 RepID=A0A0H2RTD1_9AGAM|nr:hypothetical protein SCHPADRAFT_279505 [Schizopora paradoxa]